jgi:hypothetical protein
MHPPRSVEQTCRRKHASLPHARPLLPSIAADLVDEALVGGARVRHAAAHHGRLPEGGGHGRSVQVQREGGGLRVAVVGRGREGDHLRVREVARAVEAANQE